ncbi:hypothetical protein RND81_13G017800 [Saponaria officinalis]|uniref:Aminotransferase-like plant mobile domain-containing protein n=1 Tax=Saponaria officinalis TaxID=3572 RepID=A0AAW1GXM5_SAPOF
MDWGTMGAYDWVFPALGLTIKYLRDAVRPDRIDKGSQPSLVFPGFIMESWVFSQFPDLLPQGFVAPSTYPAACAWAACNRKALQFTYHDVRRMLNEMTFDRFVPKPWGRYTRVPAALGTRFEVQDSQRLYLATSFDSFWYLGERLSSQTRWDRPIVPLDPPSILFVQTLDPDIRLLHLETMSDDFLMMEADYRVFAMRLAPRRIEAYDPEMAHQPPDFSTEVEYEYPAGVRRTVELAEEEMMVTDFGMEGWGSRVIKVAGDIHRKLWRTANRWRAVAARRTRELCQSRAETERIRREYEEYQRQYPQ